MSELVIINKSDLVSIADKVRSIVGSTNKMSLNEMQTNLDNTKTNIDNVLTTLANKGIDTTGAVMDDIASLIDNMGSTFGTQVISGKSAHAFLLWSDASFTNIYGPEASSSPKYVSGTTISINFEPKVIITVAENSSNQSGHSSSIKTDEGWITVYHNTSLANSMIVSNVYTVIDNGDGTYAVPTGAYLDNMTNYSDISWIAVG